MSRYVVDASVAVKWFLSEPGDDKARRLLDADHELLAPELLVAEVSNVLWKRFQRAEMSIDEARAVLAGPLSVKMVWRPVAPLSESALEIACRLGRTAYDSIYLALAVLESSILVIADERLYNAIAASPLSGSVTLLAHLAM